MLRQETPDDKIARLQKEKEEALRLLQDSKAKHAAVIKDRDAKVAENGVLAKALREAQDHVVRLTQQIPKDAQVQQLASLQAENAELRRLCEAAQAQNRALEQELAASRAQTKEAQKAAQHERDLHAQTLQNNFAVREMRDEITKLIQSLNPKQQIPGVKAGESDSDYDSELVAPGVHDGLFDEQKIGGSDMDKLPLSRTLTSSPVLNERASGQPAGPANGDLKSSGAAVQSLLAKARKDFPVARARTAGGPLQLNLSGSGELASHPQNDSPTAGWVEGPPGVLTYNPSAASAEDSAESEPLLQHEGSTGSQARMGKH